MCTVDCDPNGKADSIHPGPYLSLPSFSSTNVHCTPSGISGFGAATQGISNGIIIFGCSCKLSSSTVCRNSRLRLTYAIVALAIVLAATPPTVSAISVVVVIIVVVAAVTRVIVRIQVVPFTTVRRMPVPAV